MFDKNQALDLLTGAVAELAKAKETLDTIKKEDGEVTKLRPKRNAIKEALDAAEGSLASLRAMVQAFEPPTTSETGTTVVPPEGGGDGETEGGGAGEAEGGTGGVTEGGTGGETETEVGEQEEPPADLFSVEDQHAVSKLMQDSKVHLAVQRKRDFWEIRHRNTADGAPSEPIREKTIAECYKIYERQAVRGANFKPFVPRRLTREEQQALVDMRNMPIDNPRSVRWEDGMTEVDYIDKNRQPAGGHGDDVRFAAGQLVEPVGFMKTVLS